MTGKSVQSYHQRLVIKEYEERHSLFIFFTRSLRRKWMTISLSTNHSQYHTASYRQDGESVISNQSRFLNT